MNIALIGSLLLGMVAFAFAEVPAPATAPVSNQVPAPAPLEDEFQGNLSIRDVSNRHCSLPVGAAGSGLDRQYEFSVDKSPCKELNNKAREIGFYNLPSATQIILTDSATCDLSSDPKVNKFWIKLKTLRKVTQPAAFTMAFPFTHQNGEVIAIGIQLVDKYLDGDSLNALDKLSCVRIINSRAKLPAAVAPVVTEPRPWSEGIEEKGSEFHCEGDLMLVGRAHHGDESHPTQYRCATASQNAEAVSLKNHYEYPGQPEHDSYFVCPQDTVMTGREHDGDERGETRYTCAEAYTADDTRLLVRQEPWSDPVREETHQFQCEGYKVLIGRSHYGDENADTRYRCGTLYRLPPP